MSQVDHAKGVKDALSQTVDDGHRVSAPPVVVFHDLSGGDFDGNMEDPDAEVFYPFQLTCVGRDPAEARHVADVARADLASVVVPGRTVVRLIPNGVGGLTEDTDTAGHPLFSIAPRWTLWTCPA